MSFAPKLSALPAAQRALWPELKALSTRFVLYGGTALALRYGHRVSRDFDFFASAPIEPDELLATVPFLRDAVVRQKSPNRLPEAVRERLRAAVALRAISHFEALAGGIAPPTQD
jgi:hypothetical protein